MRIKKAPQTILFKMLSGMWLQACILFFHYNHITHSNSVVAPVPNAIYYSNSNGRTGSFYLLKGRKNAPALKYSHHHPVTANLHFKNSS